MPDLFGTSEKPAQCSHANVKLILTPNLIHLGKNVCEQCGKFLGWAPKPETLIRHEENAKKIAQLKASTLSDWERAFIDSIKDRKHLSPKQQEKLDSMARHV